MGSWSALRESNSPNLVKSQEHSHYAKGGVKVFLRVWMGLPRHPWRHICDFSQPRPSHPWLGARRLEVTFSHYSCCSPIFYELRDNTLSY